MIRCWCGVDTINGRCAASKDHDPEKREVIREIRTLYISGPMSGHPDLNHPAFFSAADTLRENGFVTVNPAEIGLRSSGGYADLLRKDIHLLLECDGVAVLDGWWKSRGAHLETHIAGVLEMPVRSVRDWLQHRF